MKLRDILVLIVLLLLIRMSSPQEMTVIFRKNYYAPDWGLWAHTVRFDYPYLILNTKDGTSEVYKYERGTWKLIMKRYYDWDADVKDGTFVFIHWNYTWWILTDYVDIYDFKAGCNNTVPLPRNPFYTYYWVDIIKPYVVFFAFDYWWVDGYICVYKLENCQMTRLYCHKVYEDCEGLLPLTTMRLTVRNGEQCIKAVFTKDYTCSYSGWTAYVGYICPSGVYLGEPIYSPPYEQYWVGLAAYGSDYDDGYLMLCSGMFRHGVYVLLKETPYGFVRVNISKPEMYDYAYYEVCDIDMVPMLTTSPPLYLFIGMPYRYGGDDFMLWIGYRIPMNATPLVVIPQPIPLLPSRFPWEYVAAAAGAGAVAAGVVKRKAIARALKKTLGGRR